MPPALKLELLPSHQAAGNPKVHDQLKSFMNLID